MRFVNIVVAECGVRCGIKDFDLYENILARYKYFIEIRRRRAIYPLLKIYTANVHSFENILRKHFAKTLILNDGFLIHSAGIRAKNRAHLFSGISGAGKSTIAKTFKHNNILSDEVVAVRKTANGKYLAYSTPFWGEMRYIAHNPGRNFSGHIKNFYILEKSCSLKTSALPRRPSIKKILRNVIFFPNHNNSQVIGDKLLSTVMEFSKQIRIKKLSFNLKDLEKIKEIL